VSTPPPPPPREWLERSETPRTDAFIDTLPIIPMSEGPVEAARAMREVLVMWAEFAKELERELARKVWPH
jgi:hypothetical protein